MGNKKSLKTKLVKKQDSQNPYKTVVNSKWDTDKNWKYKFLDDNRELVDSVLVGVPHKRGVLNVLLNEGYVTNMLNLGLTINPDSLVLARNPEENPGKTSYDKLGNFGLDSLDKEFVRLGIPEKLLRFKKPFDNIQKVNGLDEMTVKDAAKITNMKLNDAKKSLIKKWGNKVHIFFRKNPGAEDRMLYAAYKMPNKFLKRLKKSPTIEHMYKIYTDGGLNKAFLQVDNYKDVVSSFLNDKY